MSYKEWLKDNTELIRNLVIDLLSRDYYATVD